MSKTKATVKGQLAVVIFQENHAWIAYSPELDLAGYGLNQEEAKKSFEVNVEEFFTYTIEHGTLQKEMKRLGWSGVQATNPPAFADLLKRASKNREIESLLKRPLDRPVTIEPFPITVPATFANA